ncbi:MAG TPA: S9 family peptidase [Candidatus Tumulicola sp.]|jgi:dipeptidyl aminopeptidase/acylaminoacyl peptidase
MIAPRIGVLWLVALVVSAVPVSAAAKGLELEDLRQIVGVSAPAISPDGQAAAYVRSRIDWKEDRRNAEIVLVDVKSGTSRVLTRDRIGPHAPQWSPDGTALAYLASPERGKPTQLYVLPMNGGDSLQVTKAPEGVSSYAWRPDGRSFAYVAQDEAPKKKDADKPLDAVEITDNDYLTREAPLPKHLWSVDADGSHPTRLTSGTWSIVEGSSPVWAPDGTKVYYQRQPDPIFAHFVQQTTWVHDLAAKTDAALPFAGIDGDAQVSPDGRAIALALPRHGSLYLQVDESVRALSDGRELYNSKGIDRNVRSVTWLPHDGSLLIETADGVRDVAWILDKSGARKLNLGSVDIVQSSAAKNGAIAFVGERSDHFPEIYYLAPGAAAPKALTADNAWAASFALGKIEAFRWNTDLGVQAVGVLTYPVGYVAGKKYPLVLDIHGGPVSTSLQDLAGVEAPLRQVLAKRGYFVFSPNYRGSDDQGDAFLQAIVGDVSSGPGRDNLAAVDALRETGMIDESRIFVSGWSGGGLQTSWLIGHASFWRAAVTGAGVDDWYQQAVLADINENFAITFFGGVTPFSAAGRAAYAAESPITYVDKMRTPTLILSDTRDQRVPVSQSYVLYHALKERRVPVKFVAFPRSGHFPSDPVGQEIVLRAWSGWIDRWNK